MLASHELIGFISPALANEIPLIEGWWDLVIPTDKGLDASGGAAHELAGLALYRLRGWSK